MSARVRGSQCSGAWKKFAGKEGGLIDYEPRKGNRKTQEHYRKEKKSVYNTSALGTGSLNNP